jgi:threonine dehydrogenase-like Zn-dependent dehydrogenase
MTTVKAARFHGNTDIRIEHLPAPSNPLAVGEVRIAPAYVGNCGTDVAEYLHRPIRILINHIYFPNQKTICYDISLFKGLVSR